MSKQPPAQIILPEHLTSYTDLSRTIRELEELDETLHQEALRKPDAPVKLGRSSALLEDLAQLNHIALDDENQRTQLLGLLKGFQKHAPRIHMSLAAEPSAVFLRRITAWMRANIHPLILLETGLQPTLAAGCVIRTNNKMFDLSLRHKFRDNRHLLVEKISEIGGAQEIKASQSKEAAK